MKSRFVVIRILLLPAWTLGALASCGSDAAVPDTPDAAGVDADVCTCPSAQSLTTEQFVHLSYSSNVSRYSRRGIAMRCEDGQVLIGGSCNTWPEASPITILSSGISLFTATPEHTWFSTLINHTYDPKTMTTEAICLDAPSPELPAGCECPIVEPLRDRVVRVSNKATLAGLDADIIVAGCQADAVLIGGSCSVDPYGDFSDTVTLTRSGMTPDAPGTWICGWNNTADIAGDMVATAICVTPPTEGTAPEAVPLSERITYETETRLVPTNSSLSNSVACRGGDTLLMGACLVDRDDPRSDLVTIFRHGFEDDNPNAWRCGWKNPTDNMPTATATAICLSPPDR